MDWKVDIVVALAFLAVTGRYFGVGQYYIGRARVSRRLTVAGPQARGLTSSGSGIGAWSRKPSPKTVSASTPRLRQKLRKELLRAGYFGINAVRYYVFARYATVVLLPLSVYFIFLVVAPSLSWLLQLFVVSVAAGLGIILPDAYVSRRQGALMHEYRLIFPDLLDLLIVCMSAGLSIEASISRVREHVDKRSAALALNLELLGAEMRAGRSTIEVLNALAERLGIDEAASFVAVLRHSLELGGDVVESLRLFSDEMRREAGVAGGGESEQLAGEDRVAALARHISGHSHDRHAAGRA